MPPVPKSKILLIRSDELVARVIRRTAVAAQLVMSEPVESRAIGVDGAVVVDGLRGHFDDDAGWDILAVGERYAL
jgi:hypothetical protein